MCCARELNLDGTLCKCQVARMPRLDLAELRSLETESSDEDQEEAENPDLKDENTAADETGTEVDGTAEGGENGVVSKSE